MSVSVVFLRSNPIAPDPRVEKEASCLADAGYSVRVIAWDRSAELLALEERGKVRIERLPIAARYGRGLANFPALLRWQMGLVHWLSAHRNEYTIIHACDFDTILPALWLKAHHGKTVVYDIFDFYADHLRATPSWIKGAIRRMDTWAIGRADALILADDARLRQIGGASPRSVTVIYNSPEDEKQSLEDEARRSADSAQEWRLKIAYVGLLQIERGLVELLEVLARRPEWHLDLAGFGGDEEQVLQLARALPNVTWHGRVLYDEALALSAQAEVLVATYDPTIPNHRYASPNKIFEAMMLGKPVVVAAGTHMDELIQAGGCGLVVQYGDVDALEGALASLAADPALRQALGEAARSLYERSYSWERMRQRILDLYGQLPARAGAQPSPERAERSA
jgi:glycosyltransferase involved in cell wall biosynthesis